MPPAPTELSFFPNPRRASGYPEHLERFVSWALAEEAHAEISAWLGYAPTPLVALDGMARHLGLRSIFCKYEGGRFGIGSFKALGGAYAVRLAAREAASMPVFATASDGNHGLSVAWGAREVGARCVVFLHRHVSEGRERLIRDMGAEVVRVDGTYDDSVHMALAEAAAKGWRLVPDTASSYDPQPVRVMAGYGTMVREMYDAFAPGEEPTHYFVQGGCGGLAAAVCGLLRQHPPGGAPFRFVVVEPDKADCLYASARAGHPVAIGGDLDTVMSGLSVGEVSALAWPVLDRGTDAFMTVDDADAVAMMRQLAAGAHGDAPIEVGDSGVAGLAGLAAACADEGVRQAIGLEPSSRVAVIATEGPVDRASYDRLVGRAAA
ncbi:diaminopropionate ammonia-lyase [Ancylobacter sp. MQZ15Z-1]|uniref:Diaminopropionate ammonia-lyase n=1 Tax=Ancylobacter mangrovi TaxID=2972472 RepID=A0A9X2PFN7_9HYPH|nr:diaminopropionate ammonia-lyase [Ancylobacter mangrovi]MCS0494612.1 diaminopropionate ammonia-lyase [Ancylobacter mangrovi]